MRQLLLIATLLSSAEAVLAEDKEVPNPPIVLACVDKQGQLVSTEIVHSSGIPDIDKAALEVARASKFAPGKNSLGMKKRKSCVKFRVKFILRDGEVVPAEA